MAAAAAYTRNLGAKAVLVLASDHLVIGAEEFRAGTITQRVAETRSSTPDELRRIMGAATLGGGAPPVGAGNYGKAA